MNNIQHNSRHGTIFKCEAANLSATVEVHQPPYKLSEEEKAADYVEFGAWWAMHIHPTLDSFPGVGSIHYTIL